MNISNYTIGATLFFLGHYSDVNATIPKNNIDYAQNIGIKGTFLLKY